jgi:hypothetical protein
MGKLIKNHWARLVILTAAACKMLPSTTQTQNKANTQFRSNSSRAGSLLLAQNLLGLPHQEPRWRREANPRPTSHEFDPRHHRSRMGMATTAARGYWTAPLDRSPVDRLPTECAVCALDLPGHELGTLLHHWHGSLFLGV